MTIAQNADTAVETIENAHYVVTEAQVEALAQAQYASNRLVTGANNVYLRVLIVGCQAQLGAPNITMPTKPRRRRNAADIDAQLSVLDKVHDRFYAAVLRGVTTTDIATDASLPAAERQRRSLERNRRSIFARTTKSTLASYVRAGGDLRTVNVETATKSSLRAIGRPQARPSDAVARTHDAFMKAVKQRAADNPEQARPLIDRAMAELRAILANLDTPEADLEQTIAPGRRAVRTTVGEHTWAA